MLTLVSERTDELVAYRDTFPASAWRDIHALGFGDMPTIYKMYSAPLAVVLDWHRKGYDVEIVMYARERRLGSKE